MEQEIQKMSSLLSLPEPVLPNWTTDKKKCICNVQYPITLKTSSTCATEQALFTFNLLNWNWSQPQKKKHLTLTLMLPKTLSCKVFTQVVFRQHPYKTVFLVLLTSWVITNDIGFAIPVPEQQCCITWSWENVTISSNIGLRTSKAGYNIPVSKYYLYQFTWNT